VKSETQVHDSAFTFYGERNKQFFNNMEEVKKVIHANVDMGEPVNANAEKLNGF